MRKLRFGLKSSFFLFLLNSPLYLFVGAVPLPYVGLVSGVTYLLAYFMACGRFMATVLVYAAGVLSLLASSLLGDVRIWGGRVVELYFIAAFFASLVYAATLGKGVGRALSVVLLLASVVVGGVLILVAAFLTSTGLGRRRLSFKATETGSERLPRKTVSRGRQLSFKYRRRPKTHI